MGISCGHTQQAAAWLHANGTMIWRRVYSGRPDLIAQVRAWVAMQLADTGRVDDAVLISTELVSNALLYTRSGQFDGWFGVEVSRGSDIRIAVRDLGGSAAPRIGAAMPVSGDAPAEHGYGLRLVADLGAEMGVDGNPSEGHTVWAVLPMDPACAPQAT